MHEEIQFRSARQEDLPAIVAMLANDPLGQGREISGSAVDDCYREAFAAIQRDPNNDVLVALSGGQVVGCLQLTIIANLSRGGMTRVQIEGVRVHEDFRGRRIGNLMMARAIDEARKRGCGMVQLTTDKSRPDALRFYRLLGFEASHEGMKLQL